MFNGISINNNNKVYETNSKFNIQARYKNCVLNRMIQIFLNMMKIKYILVQQGITDVKHQP